MEKDELFEQNYSNQQSQQKKQQPKKRQHIKKDFRRRDRRRRQNVKIEIQQPMNVQQPAQDMNNNLSSLQSQTSKYNRMDQFWKNDIENYYRKEFTQEDKKVLTNIINQKKPTILQIFKEKQVTIWNQKISLQYLYKYISLVQEITSDKQYDFLVLEHQNNKEYYVITVDQNHNIQKAISVTKQELELLACRQNALQKLKLKKLQYNKQLNKNQKLSEINLELIFLLGYLRKAKDKLDQKLNELSLKALSQPKLEPPPKVQENYIALLIKKNLKKALNNQQIDYLNHFKKLDIIEHVSGLIDAKPIIDKKDFEQYIRKRKLKKCGKKARWVLKTACGGCLSHFHQMYNPLSFCSECHIRYHKYCYIPKTQGICQSCFLSKSNQTKRSRINQCQLCGVKGFLYLPMDESSNAHIFCMLINGLWRMEGTQIVFKKKHIQGAIQGKPCTFCSLSNSCIYKCNCCDKVAHPFCAYLQGWNIYQQINQVTKDQVVKLSCCSENLVQKQKNQKRRKFVLNFKKCVFNQIQ